MQIDDKPISELMTPAPHSIGLEQPMAEAARRMRAHGIRHLPVLHGGVLQGIVSERDIALIDALEGVDPEVVRVEEAMTAEPYAVVPSARLSEVVRTMAEKKYGCAVVVEDEQVRGIFTTIDALRVLEERLSAGPGFVEARSPREDASTRRA